ncbi:MAG: hypothetical protein RLP44_16630 [Aggregatilineales bacterium]
MAKDNSQNGKTAEKIAEDVKEQVEHYGGELLEFAEKARNDVVKTMKSAASRIRKQVENSEDDVKNGAETVAKKLEESAEFLSNISAKQAEKVTEQAEKVVEQAEQSGWKTLLVVFVIGLVIGWLLSNAGD